jgi:ribosome-associated translation inhibitor RaiA
LKIEVTATGFRVSAAVRELVVRRVQLALSRFGRRVQKVSVRIAAPVNPLGGVDQRCRMRARLEPAGDVRAEAINGEIEAAVRRAATRLATGVAWAVNAGPDKPRAHEPAGLRSRPRRSSRGLRIGQ